jgi:hypothetical protein
MDKKRQEFSLEYQYAPSPDAEEMLAQAWDVILDLLLEDVQKELEKQSQGETC